MATVGSIVRVLPPFDAAFPGEYVVQAVNGATCTLDGGSDFDSWYLDVVGQAPTKPVRKIPITRLTFLRRIPQAKRVDIREHAKTDAILSDALDLLDAAEDINTDDPDTVAMIGYCVSLGLLSIEDQTNILA